MGWLRRIRWLLPQDIRGPMAMLYEKVAAPGLAEFHAGVAREVVAALDCGRILDVGTGPGHLLAEISRHSQDIELVGVDLSARMLKIAADVTRRSAASDGTAAERPVRLVRADVGELPFPDGTFDLVVSTLSLHHWHDAARGIAECLRVTAAGGQCWIYDLRTDVSAATHSSFVTASGLRRLALGWVFRFHGVDPDDYGPRIVARWADGASVRVQVRPAHVKLVMAKALCDSDRGARGPAAGCNTADDRAVRPLCPAGRPN